MHSWCVTAHDLNQNQKFISSVQYLCQIRHNFGNLYLWRDLMYIQAGASYLRRLVVVKTDKDTVVTIGCVEFVELLA